MRLPANFISAIIFTFNTERGVPDANSDRYILKELLGPFFFGIAVFASILVGTGPLFRIAQYISQYGASLWTCSKLLAYSLPGIIALTFPMAMLLASLMAFGRLSSSSEIVAMKSGGISFYRLATPVFIAAFGVSIFSMVFNEVSGAAGQRRLFVYRSL